MCTTDFCNDLDYDIHSGRAIPVLRLPGNRSRTSLALLGNDLRGAASSAGDSEASIAAFLERQRELRDNGSYYSFLLREEEEQARNDLPEGLRALLDYYGEEDVVGGEEIGHGVGEDRGGGGGEEEDHRAGRVPRQVTQGRKRDDRNE